MADLTTDRLKESALVLAALEAGWYPRRHSGFGKWYAARGAYPGSAGYEAMPAIHDTAKAALVAVAESESLAATPGMVLVPVEDFRRMCVHVTYMRTCQRGWRDDGLAYGQDELADLERLVLEMERLISAALSTTKEATDE